MKKNFVKRLVERISDAFLLKFIRLKEENKRLKKQCRELDRKKMDINNRYVDLREDTKMLVKMYDELTEQNKKLNKLYIELCRSIMNGERNKE